jgi:hypothetical protein
VLRDRACVAPYPTHVRHKPTVRCSPADSEVRHLNSADGEVDVTSSVEAELTAQNANDDASAARSAAGPNRERSNPTRLTPSWRTAYQRRLAISDLLVLVWVVFGTQIAWFGFGDVQLALGEQTQLDPVSYWAFSIALILLWMGALAWSDSRSYRVIGTGTTEYVRVVDSSQGSCSSACLWVSWC